MAKKVLGKGLSAIISSSPTPVDDLERGIIEDRERIVDLDVDIIKPNPEQPRTHFDRSEIEGLAESIKSVGVIQPIIVRREGEFYFVVAGERRLRAGKHAGLKKIKSIIIHTTEEENLTLALIENLQRSNLNPVEEAKAYRVLVNRFKLKQHDIADRVGKDRTTVANMLRILNLSEKILQGLADGKITVGHAKALLSFPPDKQGVLYNDILVKNLSVRALETMLESDKAERSRAKSRAAHRNPHIKKMEEMLVSHFGTKVEIKHSGSKGKIEINYYSLDDFERIIELLK